MIRPFTIVCMLMAVGSGLYLYQCKHQAQVLDREISRTLKQTEAARDRIGMLRAEWAQLNEPERVAELAREHSGLQTAKPTQFIAANDLASRLPAPVAPTRQFQPTDLPDDAEPTAPIAQAEPPAAAPRPAAEARTAPRAPVVAETKPTPAQAQPTAPAAAPAAIADAKPARHLPAAPTPAPAAAPQAAAPQVASVHPVARPLAPPRALASAAIPHNADAVGPGTVGAAVLRAMRSRESASPREEATYVPPTPAPTPAYAPPAYAPPRAAPPRYAPQPVMSTPAAPQPMAPSYTPQAYAAPSSGSMLGGARSALPPPVPFAAR